MLSFTCPIDNVLPWRSGLAIKGNIVGAPACLHAALLLACIFAWSLILSLLEIQSVEERLAPFLVHPFLCLADVWDTCRTHYGWDALVVPMWSQKRSNPPVTVHVINFEMNDCIRGHSKRHNYNQ